MERLRNMILIILGLLLVAGIAAEAVSAASAPEVGSKMLIEGGDCQWDEILAWQRLRAERRVAVEGDDSAPIACVDDAERVYLATGSGKLMISDTHGETFFDPANIVVDGRAVADVQAMGALRSSAEYRTWMGQARGPVVIAYGDSGRLLLARSGDDGATWESGGELKVDGYERLQAGGVRIAQLSDGSLRLVVAGWKHSGKGAPEGLVLASKDEGVSWSKIGTLGPRCEAANLLQLNSGEMLAAITYKGYRADGDPDPEIKRKELFNNAVVARSADGGKTWTDYRCVTRYKESPADLCQMADGTVVLTYGQQNFPFGGRAILSKDGGKTWEDRNFILGNSTICLKWQERAWLTHPGWRISSVAFKNGVILTLYTRGSYIVRSVPKVDGRDFNSEVGKEKGKSIISVRWEFGGMKKPPLGPPPGLVTIAGMNEEGYLDNGRCLVKPEQLRYGGDYFMDDEILVYRRMPAEHNVVGLGGGSIVALDSNGDPVVACGVVGGTTIYRSKDNGRTWEQTGKAPNGPESFGVLKDNTLILTYGADYPGNKRTQAVIRSNDWGKTWTEPTHVDPGAFDSMGAGGNTRVYQMPDGTAMQTCGNLYVRRIGGGLAIGSGHVDMPWDGIYRSRDGGKTWGDFSFIGHPLCESNIIKLKSGRMLAASRYQGSIIDDDFVRIDDKGSDRAGHQTTFVKNSAITYSDDDGYTWKPFKCLTRFNECPSDLAEIRDGTVIMSFMQKNNCPNGSRAMVSRDGGISWDNTQYMLAWYGGLGPQDVRPWSSSGGHTSSVLLKDGNVLTINNGYSPAANALVTEATIWKPLPGEM